MTTPERVTCDEIFHRLDDYLDRELQPEEQRLVEKHLQVCTECTRWFRFERDVLHLLRRNVQRLDIPSDLMSKVLNRLDADQ